MNRFILAYLLCFGQVAKPQIETGTVIYVDVSKDELTIAADSRSNLADNGQHSDARCKISAFGDKFVFTAAGMTFSRGDKGESGGKNLAPKLRQSILSTTYLGNL